MDDWAGPEDREEEGGAGWMRGGRMIRYINLMILINHHSDFNNDKKKTMNE